MRSWIEIDLFKLEQTAAPLAVQAAHAFVEAARRTGYVQQIKGDGMADTVRVTFPFSSERPTEVADLLASHGAHAGCFKIGVERARRAA